MLMECIERLHNVRRLLLELCSLAQKLYHEAHGSRSFYYSPYTSKQILMLLLSGRKIMYKSLLLSCRYVNSVEIMDLL